MAVDCLRGLGRCLPCGAERGQAAPSRQFSEESRRSAANRPPVSSLGSTYSRAQSRLSFFTALSRSLSEQIVEEDLQQTSGPFTATQQERARIDELKGRAVADGIFGGVPGGERWSEDIELLRYVRGRPTSEESLDLLREAMAWRRDHLAGWGAEEVSHGSYGARHASYRSGQLPAPDWWSFLREHLPVQVYGRDRYGVPILYFPFGRADMVGLAREVGIDLLQRYMVYTNDYQLDAALRQSKEWAREPGGDPRMIHGIVQVVDMEGLTFSDVRRKGPIGKEINMGVKCLHPERCRRTIVVRAPRAFSMLWVMAKSFMDPRTVERTTILSHSSSVDLLLDELGQENVPPWLGGESADVWIPEAGSAIPEGEFQRFKDRRRTTA